MSKEKFEHYVKFGDFLEWEFVHGNRYGTLTDPLYDTLEDGDVMLLDIDVVGGKNVMEEFPDDTLSIFIEPPGLNISEQKIILEEIKCPDPLDFLVQCFHHDIGLGLSRTKNKKRKKNIKISFNKILKVTRHYQTKKCY